MWKLKLLYPLLTRRRASEGELFTAEPAFAPVPRIADFGLVKKYEMEFALLGVSARCHPTELLRPRAGMISCNHFGEFVGRSITTVGWTVAYRRTTTKDRKEMLFLTCEDRTGIYEVILFPEVCARDGDIMFKSRMIEIMGTVEQHGQIRATHVKPFFTH
jgi:DNA polymerase III alpha subunit